MSKHPFPAVAALTLVLSACAGPEPGSPQWTLEQERHKQEVRADAVKQSLDDAPDWYLSPPPDEEAAIYASGTAVSSDLQFAIDRAVLGAKRTLADRVNSKVSAKMKEFLAESGVAEDPQTLADSQSTTINLITEVNLSGYGVKDRKVLAQGGGYRAYALVQYPLGQANRMLLDQIRKNARLETKVQASKAYQELEKDVRDARTDQVGN